MKQKMQFKIRMLNIMLPAVDTLWHRPLRRTLVRHNIIHQ